MFVDREKELRSLKEALERDRNSFIVIYGRRRIGKTSLIKELLKEKDHVYYLATELPIKQQFEDLQKQVGKELGDDLLKKKAFNEWDDFFNYISDIEKSFTLVIDEFPYLIEAENAISSVFQKGWDEHIKGSEIDLVLCGSSISMMEDNILKSDSPLYGRKTSQIKLKELPLTSLKKFLPRQSTEDIIRYYSVYGGVPAYLEMLNSELSFEENLKRSVLNIDAPLKDAVDFILKAELRRPERYRSILSYLARGVTTLNGLSQQMGLEGNRVSQYLSKLRTLELVIREEPVTLSSKKKRRRGIYKIIDNFFRFYFYYILPNRSDIEEGRVESVLGSLKENESSYISPIFEEICRDYVRKTTSYSKIGKWWYQEEEIDVVALDPTKKKMLIGECKWTDNPIGKDLYQDMLEKEKRVRWNKGDREVEYAIFSRSGFDDGVKNLENLLLLDTEDIWKDLTELYNHD
ncbi:MAG: ATP-binding protein [Candidatus Natronoplasma sp.]